MKLRSFFSVLAASVVALLLIGGGGWLWLLAHSPLTLLQGGQAAPSAATFVPRQAPAMVSLLVNPDRLVALRKVIAAPRQRSRSEPNQLRQMLASTGLDYETDIRPWLGEEITLAVTTLDIDRQSENGQQPGYLLALETRDVEETQVFLQHFWDRSANLSEQYQGVKLISAQPEVTSGQPDQGQGLVTATAVVGRFVLFANHSKVLRSAINTAQVPDLGLDQASSYRRALASFQQGWVGFTWLNPQANQQAPVKLAAQTSEIAIALGLNRQGILAESALITSAVSANQPAGSAGQVLNYIPATSPFTISGINLDQLWSDISSGLLSYDWVANLVNPSLSELKTRWGLDLPQDIFAWVKGEYAIAMLPSSHQGQRGVISRPDWLFVARNQPEAEQAMQHLDAVAKQQGLGVGPLAIAGQKTSAWTQLVATTEVPAVDPGILQARVVGVHRAIDNYQVLASSLEAMNQVQASEHLSASDNFKRAIAPLPTPSDGYLYLDWPASRPLLEQQFPVLRALEVAGQSFFSHLRSVSLNTYGTEAGVLRGKIFVRLG